MGYERQFQERNLILGKKYNWYLQGCPQGEGWSVKLTATIMIAASPLHICHNCKIVAATSTFVTPLWPPLSISLLLQQKHLILTLDFTIVESFLFHKKILKILIFMFMLLKSLFFLLLVLFKRITEISQTMLSFSGNSIYPSQVFGNKLTGRKNAKSSLNIWVTV